MTSKLPVRRNIASSFKIASNLENLLEKTLKPTKNAKVYKKFSANFNGHKTHVNSSDVCEVDADVLGKQPIEEQKLNRQNWKALVR